MNRLITDYNYMLPKNKPHLKKLNLGCGMEYRKNWVNIDFDKNFKADLYVDITKIPYPLEDESFDLVYCKMVLEHVKNPSQVINETYRILKKGGQFIIITPHFTSSEALCGDIHVSTFNCSYWEIFAKSPGQWGYKVKSSFGYLNKRIEFGKGRQFWNNIIELIVNAHPKIQKIYEGTFLRNLFPAENWVVIYEKKEEEK